MRRPKKIASIEYAPGPSKANAMASEADLPSALFNPETLRHVLPPRTSEWMYETHGLLDCAGGSSRSR